MKNSVEQLKSDENKLESKKYNPAPRDQGGEWATILKDV